MERKTGDQFGLEEKVLTKCEKGNSLNIRRTPYKDRQIVYTDNY